ncbi:YwqG family protein [Lysinibacillus pakistanensis]|uniref:YwqG family protein n=1 Tax=Lysinibacillus pakistanensis TaxID=759811 RepID=A0AAX3WUT4_9BACI|nr:YwqG family protein [Lysinibacillus pakistanensis]MDM5230420.1 YwqG family protein [Lysinibacillus pakistanensis]WHY46002.1 YwqG family protein [Lysinibacillus pakistanensis]WHY51014.1 YwqG family protein [Lysinibacillus pakistanensis]
MSEKSVLMLPEAFEVYRKTIEETLQPVINIETTMRKTSLFESKFAGSPYFPLSMEYPKNSDGQPLKLLAQINFEEVPNHLSKFPEEGILQFFIDSFDDVLGMDFGNGQNQKGFRVIYHERIVNDASQLIQDFSFLEAKKDDMYFPVEKEMALTFEVAYEPLSIDDFRSDDHYASILGNIEDDALEDAFYETLTGDGHKIGGYPFFTQDDPRAYGDYQQSTVLLLQIDSVGDHIMWGDCGVGNFFITEEELQKKDFSKVLYNWDCH